MTYIGMVIYFWWDNPGIVAPDHAAPGDSPMLHLNQQGMFFIIYIRKKLSQPDLRLSSLHRLLH
jgi:hypothetical protein